REAWKYGMRAFRYCQHDCGHAIAAVTYAASALGWRSRLLTAPGDAQIAALLGLEHDAIPAEVESADCVLWISAGEPPPTNLPPTPSRWHGKPNRLSSDHREWADIEGVHRLTHKPDLGFEIGDRLSAMHETAGDLGRDVGAAQIF